VALSSLKLHHFRNFKKAAFSFSPTVTVIVGQNASGKTNILEAINYLATAHSFKTRIDREVIAFGETAADILGQTSDATLSVIISSSSPTKKAYQINKVPKLAHGFMGYLKTVVFRPEDIDLLTDGPSLRRDFLDSILGQTNKDYARAHTVYHKVLAQRNRILSNKEKSLGAKLAELEFWNQELLKAGQFLQKERAELIQELNNGLPQVISTLFSSSSSFPLSLLYQPNIINRERLASHQEAELAAGLTLIGPQRDDFEVLQDKKSLAAYGSRGQERTAILALKIAELEHITKVAGEKPLLLLDDIFSELDEAHRLAVFNIVSNQQTILTATEIPKEIKNHPLVEKIEVIRL
jgi:DNA replication and repair protein RecF